MIVPLKNYEAVAVLVNSQKTKKILGERHD